MSERAIHLATLAMSPNPMNLFRNKIKIILLYFIIHQIVLEGEGGAAEGHHGPGGGEQEGGGVSLCGLPEGQREMGWPGSTKSKYSLVKSLIERKKIYTVKKNSVNVTHEHYIYNFVTL